ncbi:MAG: homoserine dehydrogenase [Leptospiraceae bacterium]|nr:homoserine dehydrogenase [Leptospiraceae bacterium]MCP5495945.1 homoserine dehydrogenase [Leptospiraceae bacterium]
MKSVNIGLIGVGTVGSGLIQILNQNRELIQKRTGLDLTLKVVCDKDTSKLKDLGGVELTQDFHSVINRGDLHCIVELVGGTGIAFDIIRDALLSKKTVITANKALLSEKGTELFKIANENSVEIGYEAAVGGAIPLIRSVKTGLVANQFKSIYGILNGTTNFILSKMEEENLDYELVLKKAQELGFAEKDPTFDVEGIDAAHKISILGSIAFDCRIKLENVYVEGITKISKTEINFAKQLGYRIKLLGICKMTDGHIEARVNPAMLPLNHPLASIMNEMNAVYLETQFSGPTMLSGKGAGSLPTASAIISDIAFYSERAVSKDRENEKNIFQDAKMLDQTETLERYYIRFNTVDKPGVLAILANVLGKYQISISTLRQNEVVKEPVEVIIITHPAKEKDIRQALEEIDRLNVIKEQSVMVRIEGL